MLGQNALTPLIIMIWLGFAACVGLILAGRMSQNTLRRRIKETVRSNIDLDSELIIQQQTEMETDRGFGARVLAPMLGKMGRGLKATAKGTSGRQVSEMLEQAGHPLGMNYPEFYALKVFGLLTMTFLGLFSSFVVVPFILRIFELPSDPQSSLMLQMIWVLAFAFAGFAGPTFWLRRYLNRRIRQIRKAMADVVDLIVLAIEAGLGFDSAVGITVSKTKGPLTDELRRVLSEINVGKSQGEAFRDMALRVRMPELSLLVAAIDQATKMGVGLAHALRIQSAEIRERRMAYVREQAGKLPVKMMLPLVFFIFPALFVVILGPAACQMQQMSDNGELDVFNGK